MSFQTSSHLRGHAHLEGRRRYMQRPSENLCEGEGYPLTPFRGKPRAYIPKCGDLSSKSGNLCMKKARPHAGTGPFSSNLLKCDLCASCFESCLCLICCLLVCLLKKCCRCCINKILSFLKTKCRVEVTYFLDNRNLL